jgi:UDP-N-acetylmuramoyl-tripeptide--D-alanyl-D-alanine ligase
MILHAHELAEATGGTLVAAGPAGPLGTDSRRLRPGTWFVALSGDRFDGHDFLGMARDCGCAGAIGRRVPEGWDRGFVQVEDGLTALQDVARHVRRGFPGPVVGITGSAGKTTTRALTALALEGLGPIHATQGNLNNHIGVPLTILRAEVGAAAWVLEMGMSGFGEIDLLQDIGAPTVRVVTNVGAAHLEGVGSLDGVARAKGEMFDGARPGDVCIVNADDPRVAAMPIPDGVRVLRYGSSQGCDVRLTDAVVDPVALCTRFRIEAGAAVVRGTIPAPGAYLAENAAAAVAVAVALRAPLDGIAARFAAYEPVGMRLRVEAAPAGSRVLNDAYNANPLSVNATLRTLAAMPGRRVALLGDMLELGDHEAALHEDVLAHALRLGLDGIGTVGPRFSAAAARLSAGDRVHALDTPEALADAVHPGLTADTTVLIKGSRGLAMERILRRWSADPSPGEDA